MNSNITCTKEIPMPKYNEFETTSEQFAQKVKIYNVNVNQSGVWLFLATRGC